jgi:glycerol kinase
LIYLISSFISVISFIGGLYVGFWKSADEITSLWQVGKVFKPQMDDKKRSIILKSWENAVARTRNWTIENKI